MQRRYWHQLLQVCSALTLGALVLFVYIPGTESVFQFDDSNNLDGLSNVGDISSALSFVLSGDAGPSGRPISLATFLPQAGAWPDNPEPFLWFNIVLHLLNGVLVGFFAFQVIQLAPHMPQKRNAYWLALASSAVWLCLPLLASSSLFVIQRMTTLSAFFVLLGLCLHLHGRALLTSSQRLGSILIAAGAATGIGLGVLSKENAAIYPLLVMSLDRTLLAGLVTTSRYYTLRKIFILIPALFVFGFMGYRLLAGTGYEFRHFDVVERTLTQGVVLFDYLRALLIPNSAALTPFHDAYPVYGGFHPAIALSATIAWLSAAVAAFILGPRWPIPAFAILWFLSGHFLESTWIGLELYFEHRNYLPAVGITLAIVLGVSCITRIRDFIKFSGLTAYTLVLAASLFQVTSLWGTPRSAAQLWWERNPDSMRAAQFLSNYHLEENNPEAALRILDETMSRSPKQVGMTITSVRIECAIGRSNATRERFQDALQKAPTIEFAYHHPSAATVSLDDLYADVTSGRCSALRGQDVDRLAVALMDNAILQASDISMHNLHVIRARLAYPEYADQSIDHLLQALRYRAYPGTAERILELCQAEGKTERLEELVRIMETNTPSLLGKRHEWTEIKERADTAFNQPPP